MPTFRFGLFNALKLGFYVFNRFLITIAYFIVSEFTFVHFMLLLSIQKPALQYDCYTL